MGVWSSCTLKRLVFMNLLTCKLPLCSMSFPDETPQILMPSTSWCSSEKKKTKKNQKSTQTEIRDLTNWYVPVRWLWWLAFETVYISHLCFTWPSTAALLAWPCVTSISFQMSSTHWDNSKVTRWFFWAPEFHLCFVFWAWIVMELLLPNAVYLDSDCRLRQLSLGVQVQEISTSALDV